jgi:hypothetical protein
MHHHAGENTNINDGGIDTARFTYQGLRIQLSMAS